MSLAVELWRVLEAWDAARHPRGPGGRFIKVGGSSDRPSLADVIRGTTAGGPKRQRDDKGGMSVADAVRSAARRSDSTGRPTQRNPAEHRAEGAHDVADEVDRALADAGVPEDVRRQISERARAAADSHGKRRAKSRSAAPAVAPPEAPAAAPTRADVTAAVARLAADPNDWVGLADLRDALGAGRSRDEVDALLRQMAREPGVRIIPVANSKGLRPRDREAALRIGVEDNHSIQIDADARAVLAAPPAAVNPTPASSARRTAATAAASKLETASSMADGRAALSGLTVAQLRQVAEQFGVPVGSKDTKARAVDRLVDSVVGRRLDSAAITRMVNR